MAADRVVVIGAGIGGLSAAIDLARQGMAVTVLERADNVGGKMRTVLVDGRPIDAGPTVFTLRHVFDGLFDAAGARFEDAVGLVPLRTLARHTWRPGEVLDLFADEAESADAIGRFAGAAEADGYRRFAARTRLMFDTLDKPFMRAALPTPLGLVRSAGLSGLGDLARITPFETMWSALGGYFRDPRLRQMFGRYATYCGASPYRATATLMLIAHAERAGVWRIAGGMHALARAMAALATRLGAVVRTGAAVAEVVVRGGRAAGVRLTDGEEIAAEAVVCNADAASLAAGAFGAAGARAAKPVPVGERSLSAVTWACAAEVSGFDLHHHTVFFSDDYAREFDDIFARRRLPERPTVYVCAQDRGEDAPAPGAGTAERLLVLVNAPAVGDLGSPTTTEAEQCGERAFSMMARAGLTVRRVDTVVTGPAEFETLFPRTGGALYGRALHGTMASFSRPGSGTGLPGLYQAGGGAHPGAGVPMAALSGRLAASLLMADRGSRRPSGRVAMRGGISMG